MNLINIIILGIFGISLFAYIGKAAEPSGNSTQTIYKYKVKDIEGKEVSLSDYKGKVILIVNVASKCGFTPQYKGMQELYDKYSKQGFTILAFPCNQFKNQEPGTNNEIKEFCSINYGVTFPLMDKIDVNGENAHPLYQFLTNYFGELVPIKWNFTKFLIGKDGIPIARFETKSEPESISPEIEKALNLD